MTDAPADYIGRLLGAIGAEAGPGGSVVQALEHAEERGPLPGADGGLLGVVEIDHGDVRDRTRVREPTDGSGLGQVLGEHPVPDNSSVSGGECHERTGVVVADRSQRACCNSVRIGVIHVRQQDS